MTTKKCSTCKETKPISEYYRFKTVNGFGYRAQCRKCKNAANRRDKKTKITKPKEIRSVVGQRSYASPFDACYTLVVNMIYQAFSDGQAHIDSNDIRTHGQEGVKDLIKDGNKFFIDGRYAHFADLIGLDPDMRPQWVKDIK